MKKTFRNITLAGVKHCGKSTLGRLLAAICGASFTDSDDELCLRYGKPVREIFRELGEENFRRAEAEVLEDLAARDGFNVFSLGGGAVSNAFVGTEIWEQLGCKIMIDIPDAAAQERVFASGVPAYLEKYSDPRRALEQINRERIALLKAKCDAVYHADPALQPEEQAEKLHSFIIQEFSI